MSRIRAENTSPELLLRSELWKSGVRYRLHFKTPMGRADIVIPGAKVAVFVDGCFWHGCPEHYVRPRSQNAFWDQKLLENVTRDRRQTLGLCAAGWRVMRLWEHEVTEDPKGSADRLVGWSQGGRRSRLRQWRVMRVEFLDRAGTFERRYLEALDDPRRQRVEEGQRSTRKSGRVRRRRVKESAPPDAQPRSFNRKDPS